MLHSYPINYSRVWFLFSQSDTLMLAVQGCSKLASWGLANQSWHSLQFCLCFLQEGMLSLIGVAVADTPSALDCTAGVEIAAICSNSASNFDMYENQSNSWPSPQGPGTLFDASHHQPTGIYLHLSSCGGTKVWLESCYRKGSLKRGDGFYYPGDIKIYERNLLIKECWTSADGMIENLI